MLHRHGTTVEQACRILEVSRSGYYSWANRKPRGRERSNQALQRKLAELHQKYDNAVAENFFSCLKCELIHLKQYPTRASARIDVFAYLEAFYNSVRPHSALGWHSPAQFEASLLTHLAA